MKNGKAYANRKKKADRPASDFYETPGVLVDKLLELNEFHRDFNVYEPAAGDGAITKRLKQHGFYVIDDDIRTTGKDFLKTTFTCTYIITNPPFSLFDDFVLSAKWRCNKFAFICKTNFLGAYNRYNKGIWDNLKIFAVFNRQVDYRTEQREDGMFLTGNLVTGWGIWDMFYEGEPILKILDVNDYVIRRK
jgi:hypothetical protein